MKKKVAICLRGAVSKLFRNLTDLKQLYNNEGNYVNYTACYKSITRHIVEANAEEYEVDFFTHCWNEDLKDSIINLYQPKRHLFESNGPYIEEIKQKGVVDTEFSNASQALSMKQALILKEEYEAMQGVTYDIVILYRYDVLLWKDICLKTYDRLDNGTIYVNGDQESGVGGCNGDFHFIMSNTMSYKFKYLYNSLDHSNECLQHCWMKRYITEYLRTEILADDILPGKYQEVLRKMRIFSLWPGHIQLDMLYSYGFTLEELDCYEG